MEPNTSMTRAAASYGRRAALRTAGSWNPIAGSPAAALDTEAALAAFEPSLMPRASLHQGIAAGLAVLAGRGISAVAELATSALSAGSPALKPRLAAGATVAAVGQDLAHLPASGCTPASDSRRGTPAATCAPWRREG